MPKAIAIQKFLEWIHKPVIIASDDLVTLDIRTLAAIEDEIRSDGKAGQALAAQMQSRQLRTLCLPVASLGGTDPMTRVNEFQMGKSDLEFGMRRISAYLASIPTQTVRSLRILLTKPCSIVWCLREIGTLAGSSSYQ
jgi:hypothetical protein